MAELLGDAFPPLPSRPGKGPRKTPESQAAPAAPAAPAAAPAEAAEAEVAEPTAEAEAQSPPPAAAQQAAMPSPSSPQGGGETPPPPAAAPAAAAVAATVAAAPASTEGPGQPISEETEDALPELDGLVMLALKSPKERSFLLKLETHIINNLQSGTIERIKLTTPIPPKLRKLVHMVADYFGLHRNVDKEEGEEKKATMTLLKMPQTRIPARTLSVICAELDDEDRQPVQLQRKAAEGPGADEGEVASSVPLPSQLLHGQVLQPPPEASAAPKAPASAEESKPSWAEVAARGDSAVPAVPLAAGPLPTNVAFAKRLPLNVGVAAKARPKDATEGPLVMVPPQGEDGHEDESSPIEVSPCAAREDGDEDDATLSDDEAEDGDASEEELVSRPQPTFVPGKIKVMQRRQAEGEEVPKSSGDESEPAAAKIDPSRLPLEERERYYLQARARIFGESGKAPETPEVDPEDAPVVEDPQTVQRRAARELKLAQERINDLKDPAYSRAIYPRFGYAMKGKGRGMQGFIAGFQAAPTDYRGMSDPSQAPLASRAAAVEGNQGQFASSSTGSAGGQNNSWRQSAGPQQQNVQQNQQQQQQPAMQPQSIQPQSMQQQALQQQALQQQAMQQQALQQQALQQQVLQMQQQAMQQQAQQALQQHVIQQQAMQQAMQQLLLQQQNMQQQAMQQQSMQQEPAAGPMGQQQQQQQRGSNQRSPQQQQQQPQTQQQQQPQQELQQRLQMVSAMYSNQQDRSDPSNMGNPRIAL